VRKAREPNDKLNRATDNIDNVAQHQQYTQPTVSSVRDIRRHAYGMQILYQMLGPSGWSDALLPHPHSAICCYRAGAKTVNLLLTYRHSPHLTHGRLHDGPVCVLLPSIRISLVVVSVRYHRRSLSHDITAMCGWRSIS